MPSPEEAPVARLATVDAHGRPHVVPICFVLEGDTLYTAVDEKPKRSRQLKRLANIEADPHVEVVIDHYEDDWSRLWWVRVRGRAEVHESGPTWDRAVALLQAKYVQYRERPPTGAVWRVAMDELRWWRP